MGKYIAANPVPLVTLKHNPYQVAAIQALAARHCPACQATWHVEYGHPKTKRCPQCGTEGERDYTRISLVAGRQGGKTRWGTLAVILELSMPESYWWVTAPTYRDLTDFVEPAFFAQIPQRWVDEGQWSASDRILTLPNKSVVAFRSLESPQSMRGPTLDGALMDEACKVAELTYSVGNATLAAKRGVWLFTTTPQGEDWVYEKLMLPAEAGEPGFWLAKYKSIENPIMSSDFIESQRRQMSDEMFRQEFEADIVTFQGAIYGDLVQPCLIDDTALGPYLPNWPVLDPGLSAIVGLDPGSAHPFAGVLGVATPHAMVICAEYLEREKLAMVHAQNLRQMVYPLSPRWGIDRSQAQMVLELNQHGIFAQGAENAVDAGIERVKSWMKSGRLKIVRQRCPRLIKELVSYRWKDTTANDGSTGRQEPFKKRDDLCDALRYALMLWPHLPVPIELPTSRDLSALPEKVQRDIARMERRLKHDDQLIAEGMGDFYRTDDLDLEDMDLTPQSVAGDFYA